MKKTPVLSLALFMGCLLQWQVAWSQPANDLCANAILLTSCTGGTQSVSGTTTGATVDSPYTNCGAGGTVDRQRGVWYYYVGDNNAIDMNTCNSTGYDTRITVYNGSCGALTSSGLYHAMRTEVALIVEALIPVVGHTPTGL